MAVPVDVSERAESGREIKLENREDSGEESSPTKVSHSKTTRSSSSSASLQDSRYAAVESAGFLDSETLEGPAVGCTLASGPTLCSALAPERAEYSARTI